MKTISLTIDVEVHEGLKCETCDQIYPEVPDVPERYYYQCREPSCNATFDEVDVGTWEVDSTTRTRSPLCPMCQSNKPLIRKTQCECERGDLTPIEYVICPICEMVTEAEEWEQHVLDACT